MDMNKIKRKILTFLLSFTVIATSLAPTTVYAGQNNQDAIISELEIVGLDEPVAGKEFDTTATVTTAEGVTWEIPVIWVDEQGRQVVRPVAGKKYFPTFVFYVPEGYKVAGVGSDGKYSIKYPDFVVDIYGTDHVIFVADPGLGVTYMFVANDYNWAQYHRLLHILFV